MINKIREWSGVIALIAIIAFFVFGGAGKVTTGAKALGGVTTNCGGTVTCFTDLAVNNLYTAVNSWLGGSSDSTGQASQVTVGACNSATTTIFAATSPFTSTSTAQLTLFTATGQATTSLLRVGTTTQSTGLTAALVSTTLVNDASIATTTQATVVGGVTGASADVPAGSGTSIKIVVPPSGIIGGFATSTATAAGAANYTGGFTSCQYKIKWER